LAKFNTEDEDIQEIINAKYAKLKPKVLIGGIINYMGSRPTKKGGKIAFIRIEDASGELEFVVFNDDYERFKHLFKIDELIFVEGEVIYDSFRNEVKVNANKILLLDEVLNEKVSQLDLDLKSEQDWEKLKPILNLNSDGSASVRINYSNLHARCILRLGESAKFSPTFDALEQLSAIVGKTHWRLGLNKV
jgi:DNA polymerase-3 subunit alpha